MSPLRFGGLWLIIVSMKAKLKTTLLPILTALIWGTAFVAQDVCAGRVPPMTFNALRFFIAVVFLFAVKLVMTAVRRKKGVSAPPSSIEERKKARRTLVTAGLLCGLALGVASILQQAGMEAGTDSGKSGFITALYVVLVPIGGLMLGRRLPGIFWAGLALAVLGLYLLCISGSFSFAPGDLLTLFCAAAFTVQILLIDKFASSLDPIEFCMAEFITAGLMALTGAVIFESPDRASVMECAFPILYVAVFSCGVAYLLQIIAQREGDPAIVSLLFSLESVFSVIGGAVILHQRMTAREYLGCALIFAAVVIAQLPEKKPKTPSEPVQEE